MGKVVVDGDYVHTAAGDRVQVYRKRRSQRFSLPGLHFGDLAPMQHYSTNQLDVVMPLAERAPSGLAHCCKGWHEEIIEVNTLRYLTAERGRPRVELGIGECGNLRFQGVDCVNCGFVRLDDLVREPALEKPGDALHEALAIDMSADTVAFAL